MDVPPALASCLLLHSVTPKLADPLAPYLAHLLGYQEDTVLEEDIAGVCAGSPSSIWWLSLKGQPETSQRPGLRSRKVAGGCRREDELYKVGGAGGGAEVEWWGGKAGEQKRKRVS